MAYRSSVVTPDTAEALRLLEVNAAKTGNVLIGFRGAPKVTLNWKGPLGPTNCPPQISLRPTGREVYLRVHLQGFKGTPEAQKEAELITLWGLAIPLGFTPWSRYPIPGPHEEVFHFFGPWKSLFDNLCSEGLGEYAWASVCAAAQSDVGTWEGDRVSERFVQAQLHRLGLHCGPINGIIEEEVIIALRALGFQGKALEEMIPALAKFQAPNKTDSTRRMGQILLPGDDVSVVSYGDIAITRTKQGTMLAVDGPGKIIVTVGR